MKIQNLTYIDKIFVHLISRKMNDGNDIGNDIINTYYIVLINSTYFLIVKIHEHQHLKRHVVANTLIEDHTYDYFYYVIIGIVIKHKILVISVIIINQTSEKN